MIGTTDQMKRKLVVLQKYNSSLQHAVGSLFLSSLMELFIMALLEVVHVQLCFYHIQLYITTFQVLGPLELTKVDSTSCEMDGIVLGLELLLQYFTDVN